VNDLEAVVSRTGADQVAIMGYLFCAQGAMAFAARNPDRVSHLILWCSAVSGSAMSSGRRGFLTPLMETDWETFIEQTALTWFGFSGAEQARSMAAALRQSTSPEKARAAVNAINTVDVSDILTEVRCPTLVLHRAGVPNVDAAHYLASHIPDARLAIFDGDSAIPYLGDTDSVLTAVREFLGPGGRPPGSSGDRSPTLRTVLFTDIVGHAEMMQRLGDATGRDVLREHERITRETLRQHGGEEVKTMGDGFMASFGSVTQALECAIALQRAFAQHSADEGEPLPVRVGLNAGEPIEEEGDLFGSTVILASRIAARAGAGEILIPDTVRGLLSGKNFLFSDRGEFVPKGFDDAVRLYEVRWKQA
jgi:class 3 adenylate cyclase